MSYNNQIHSYICCCSQMFWGKLQANLQSWKDPLMNLKVKIVNYFVSISHYFYIYLREKMELAQRLWGNNLIQTSEEEIDARIKEFRHVYKIPFLERCYGSLILLFLCPISLAFDSFTITSDFDIEKIKCINVLKEFYCQPQQSTFNNETNVSNLVIDKTELDDDTIRSCFTNFMLKLMQS